MRIVIVLIALIIPFGSNCQDVHFSQYGFNFINYNPASVGSIKKIEGVMQYRSQWKSVVAPYTTFNTTVAARIHTSNSGILAMGLNMMTDRSANASLGIFKIELPIAYQLKVSSNSLVGAGIGIGYYQNTYNSENFTWNSQYDGNQYNAALPSNEGSGTFKFNYVNLSAGLSWVISNGEKYMTSNDSRYNILGVSVDHLNKIKYSFFEEDVYLAKRISIYDQFFIGIPNSRIAIIPSFLLQFQGKQKEIMLGTMVRIRLQDESVYTGFVKGSALSLGLFNRFKDAYVVQFQLEVDKYAIGISYDFNTSNLREASSLNGGFEIGIKFINPGNFGAGSSSKLF